MTEHNDDPTVTGPLVTYRLLAVEKAVTSLGDRMDLKLDAMKGQFVSAELYNADKQGNSDRHSRSEQRILDLESESGETTKFRRQAGLSVGIAAVSASIGIAGLIAAFLR